MAAGASAGCWCPGAPSHGLTQLSPGSFFPCHRCNGSCHRPHDDKRWGPEPLCFQGNPAAPRLPHRPCARSSGSAARGSLRAPFRGRGSVPCPGSLPLLLEGHSPGVSLSHGPQLFSCLYPHAAPPEKLPTHSARSPAGSAPREVPSHGSCHPPSPTPGAKHPQKAKGCPGSPQEPCPRCVRPRARVAPERCPGQPPLQTGTHPPGSGAGRSREPPPPSR